MGKDIQFTGLKHIDDLILEKFELSYTNSSVGNSNMHVNLNSTLGNYLTTFEKQHNIFSLRKRENIYV